jgi:hypothetical protein
MSTLHIVLLSIAGYLVGAFIVYSLCFILDTHVKADMLLPVIAFLYPLWFVLLLVVAPVAGIVVAIKWYKKTFLTSAKDKYKTWKWKRENDKAFAKQQKKVGT